MKSNRLRNPTTDQLIAYYDQFRTGKNKDVCPLLEEVAEQLIETAYQYTYGGTVYSAVGKWQWEWVEGSVYIWFVSKGI